MLFELAEDEDDADTRAEADAELAAVRKDVDELEVRTLLSGEYDAREALVTIRSEAGGVDAADFAEKLQRMYLRWAERHGYPTEVYDTSYAEEAGIKSTTFAVKAPYAYGTLSRRAGHPPAGPHLARSTTRAAARPRFAGVEVLPVVEQTDHIDIHEDELRVDVYRSSGPGGQGVNTTDSAVRLTHLPDRHRRLLPERALADPEQGVRDGGPAGQAARARAARRSRPRWTRCKGDGGNSWGTQIRYYVLHPYQMVKDLRTELRDVGNPRRCSTARSTTSSRPGSAGCAAQRRREVK